MRIMRAGNPTMYVYTYRPTDHASSDPSHPTITNPRTRDPVERFVAAQQRVGHDADREHVDVGAVALVDARAQDLRRNIPRGAAAVFMGCACFVFVRVLGGWVGWWWVYTYILVCVCVGYEYT